MDFINLFKNLVGSNSVDLEKIKERLKPYRKKTWIPIVESGEAKGAFSKFGGVATLEKGTKWPACGICEKAMQMFLQLDSRDLPDDVDQSFGDGLLQVFYCTDLECELESESFFPFAKSTFVRIVNPELGETLSVNPVEKPFDAKRIVGWRCEYDYPHFEDLYNLGVSMGDEECEAFYESAGVALGDKLFGWPAWVQGPEYPNCTVCGMQMNHVFQIDSDDNVPYMFGDVGCSHITQCPEHKEVLTIAWACH